MHGFISQEEAGYFSHFKLDLKKASLVINNTINITVAAAKNIPMVKSAFFFMASHPLCFIYNSIKIIR